MVVARNIAAETGNGRQPESKENKSCGGQVHVVILVNVSFDS